jgi:hypothetical protein
MNNSIDPLETKLPDTPGGLNASDGLKTNLIDGGDDPVVIQASGQTITLPDDLASAGGETWVKTEYSFSDFSDPGQSKTLQIPLAAMSFVEYMVINITEEFTSSQGGESINVLVAKDSGGTFYPLTDITGSGINVPYDILAGAESPKAASGGRGFENFGVELVLDDDYINVTLSVTAGTLDLLTAGTLQVWHKASSIGE